MAEERGPAAALDYWARRGERDFLDPDCSASFLRGIGAAARRIKAM
jgi:hypothetical protein